MSEITSEILAKLAPGTKPASLRERFIPFLNTALPRYNITSKLRVAAFLTTTCFESNYFRATKEGKARAGTKAGNAQAKYWSTGFYGRGLIQTTHRTGYQAVGDYLKAQGVVDDADLFVNNPELLEQPKWAVESACVFWTQNKLNRYADAGNISAIEGVTNRGDAHKKAWGEADREAIYQLACKVIPDDFSLDSAAVAQTDGGSTVKDSPSTAQLPSDAALPPPIDPPVDTRESTSIQTKIDEVGDKVQSVKATAEKFQTVSVPAGLGTKLSVFWKQVIVPIVMMFWGWVSGHWQLCLIILILSLALGTFEWIENRKRNNPVGAVPSVADPTTPWWKIL